MDSVRGLSARAMVSRDGRRAIVRQPLPTRHSTSDALDSSGMTEREANLVGRANTTNHLAHLAPGADTSLPAHCPRYLFEERSGAAAGRAL